MSYNYSSKKPGTISYSLARFIEGSRNPDGVSYISKFTNISEFIDVLAEIKGEIDFSRKTTRDVFKLLEQSLLKLNEHPTSRTAINLAQRYFGNIYLKGDGVGVLRS